MPVNLRFTAVLFKLTAVRLESTAVSFRTNYLFAQLFFNFFPKLLQLFLSETICLMSSSSFAKSPSLKYFLPSVILSKAKNLIAYRSFISELHRNYFKSREYEVYENMNQGRCCLYKYGFFRLFRLYFFIFKIYFIVL